MVRKAALCSLLIAVAVDLHAACNLNFRKVDRADGKRWTLEWAKVPGVDTYLLEETRTIDGRSTTEVHQVNAVFANAGRFDAALITTDPVTVQYRLIAPNVEDCAAALNVTFAADPDFRRVTRKSIVPLVGSTRGNNGALFKTSLRLRGNTGMSGRLVLHPLGRPGNDATDPQVRYEFRDSDNGVLEYDDIVTQLGVTGLGSLDIIPDARNGQYRVPTADVRLFNVAGEGTFGTIESQTQAFDFYGGRSESIKSLTVIVPGPEMRLNIGFRTVEGSGVFLQAYRGGQTIAIVHPTVEADYLVFGSAESILGVDLQPGDEIRIMDHDGGSIPMYSLTDNKTNDPALFYPPTRVLTDLTHFEFE